MAAPSNKAKDASVAKPSVTITSAIAAIVGNGLWIIFSTIGASELATEFNASPTELTAFSAASSGFQFVALYNLILRFPQCSNAPNGRSGMPIKIIARLLYGIKGIYQNVFQKTGSPAFQRFLYDLNWFCKT